MPAPSGEATRPAWAERERADLAQIADEHLVSVLAAMAGDAARAHADQARAVEALVADQARVLVVQATGWGKSAVYWAATSAIPALGGGPTLGGGMGHPRLGRRPDVGRVAAARAHARPAHRRRARRVAGGHDQLHQ